MKKLLFLFLILFNINSAFGYDFEADGIYYEINKDLKTVSVINPNRDGYFGVCYTGDIVIPETVNNYIVTDIASHTFRDNDITSIVLPETLKSIGNCAFQGCRGLTTIKIPDSVTFIGVSAFEQCRGLANIKISDSLAYINTSVFSGCSSLTSIKIPDSVAFIGVSAFRGCSSLTSIKIPDSVTFIRDYAFRGCSSLTSIMIPDSVTRIDDGVFSGCSGLTTIKIPDSVTKLGSMVFCDCTGLESVSLPKSLKSIASGMFYSCTKLSYISIPTTLEYINYDAFCNCSNLKNIIIPRSVRGIHYLAFEDCTQLKSVIVEYASDGIKKLVFDDNYPDDYPGIFYGAAVEYLYMGRNFEVGAGESLKTVEFADGLFTIKSTFNECTNLETVIIPKSTFLICDRAFQKCRNISTIYVSNPEPPILGTDPFSYDTYAKAELHVPKGTKEKYMDAPFWCSFVNVIDDAEMCGIEEVTVADAGQGIAVYNLQGQCVLRATDEDQLQTLSPGIYIKVAGNKTEKFVVR